MKINDTVYNWLKYFTTIALPALTTLFGVIATTLGIPHAQEIITIAVAVDTCLGTLLGISTYQYNKNQKVEEK